MQEEVEQYQASPNMMKFFKKLLLIKTIVTQELETKPDDPFILYLSKLINETIKEES